MAGTPLAEGRNGGDQGASNAAHDHPVMGCSLLDVWTEPSFQGIVKGRRSSYVEGPLREIRWAFLLSAVYPLALFPLRLPLPGPPLGFGNLVGGHGFLQMVLELFSEVITLAGRQGVPPIGLNRIFRDTSALGIYDS